MNYKIIDLDSYNRKSHFEFFNSLENPYVGFTVNVDVTELKEYCKSHHISFYLTFVYIVTKTFNNVKELRHRIVDGKIYEYEFCKPSTTELKVDETYVYATYEYFDDLNKFIEEAKKTRERCLNNQGLEEEEDVESFIFISCIPWISYTQVIQPLGGNYASNPHITWGKYFEENNRIKMPLSTLCHHGLVDGVHLGKFYANVEKEINNLVLEK